MINKSPASASTSLYSWGSNAQYQLGDGSTITRSLPVAISGISDIVQISSAGIGQPFVAGIQPRTAVIDSSGNLFVWGTNTTGGELGLNDKIDRSLPTQIPGTWSKVYVAQQHTLAIRSNGTLWAWGNNTNGQLGQNNSASHSSPVQIGTGSWVAVAASGSGTSYAIDTNGNLWAWGFNGSGNLATGNTGASRSSPIQVGSLINVVEISAGTNHVIARTSNGNVFTWGNGGDGRLGNGATTIVTVPERIGVGTFSQAKKIVAAVFGGYVIDNNDKLWAWGSNAGGQLGIGVTTNRSLPVQVGSNSWKDVAGPQISSFDVPRSTIAIRSDNKLFTWGESTAVFPVSGDGTTTSRSSPVQVGTDDWTKVALGFQVSFGVR